MKRILFVLLVLSSPLLAQSLINSKGLRIDYSGKLLLRCYSVSVNPVMNSVIGVQTDGGGRVLVSCGTTADDVAAGNHGHIPTGCRQNTAVTHTGTTDETVVFTCTIPAGAMGTNGSLRIEFAWTTAASMAGTYAARIILGGINGTEFVTLTTLGGATATNYRGWLVIANRNSASAQISYGDLADTAAQRNPGITAGTVDTSAAQDLVITMDLTDISGSVVLQQAQVTLMP